MSLFAQTRHQGPGRFLRLKIWLFSIAAILMLVGMAREIDLLVFAAIALLAVAFVLRFLEKDEAPADEEEYDDFDGDGDPEALAPPAVELRDVRERPAVEEPRRRVDDEG
jgi:hypothetical protein